MELVYESSMQPVKLGDVVHLDRYPACIVLNIIEPHKPASTGRVHLRTMSESKTFLEFFPSVIGAKWIGRTDQ